MKCLRVGSECQAHWPKYPLQPDTGQQRPAHIWGIFYTRAQKLAGREEVEFPVRDGVGNKNLQR